MPGHGKRGYSGGHPVCPRQDGQGADRGRPGGGQRQGKVKFRPNIFSFQTNIFPGWCVTGPGRRTLAWSGRGCWRGSRCGCWRQVSCDWRRAGHVTSMLLSDWSRRGVLDDWLRAGGGRGGGPGPGSAALLLRGHARHHLQLRLRPHPVPGPRLRGGGQKMENI